MNSKTSRHSIGQNVIEPTKINDVLLADVLGGVPHNLVGIPPLSRGDNAIINNKNSYRLYLHYLVCELFNIRRYPSAPERTFDSANSFYEALTSEHYEQSLTELKRLYEHTQNYLNSSAFQSKVQKYMPTNGFIRIQRGIFGEYAQNMLYLKQEALSKNQPTIDVRTDIVSFFAFEPYARDLHFAYDVPLRDILICDSVVVLGNYDNPYREREFLVINRNPSGFMTIHVDTIVADRDISPSCTPCVNTQANLLLIPDFKILTNETKHRLPQQLLQLLCTHKIFFGTLVLFLIVKIFL